MKIEKLSAIFLIVGILCLAAFIRFQGITNVPSGQLTESDGYFYYWQAQLISEHGKLPERDMNRWLPLGRDLTQTLNLYGYVLAYVHKGIAWVFPNVKLYHVTIYTPVVCFCLETLGVLCLFFYRTFGILFSSIVGVLLATLPGAINRGFTAGFGDYRKPARSGQPPGNEHLLNPGICPKSTAVRLSVTSTCRNPKRGAIKRLLTPALVVRIISTRYNGCRIS